jgi:hypothetical protein
VGGIATSIAIGIIPNWLEFQKFEAPVIVWLVTSAIVDVTITFFLTWHLVRSLFIPLCPGQRLMYPAQAPEGLPSAHGRRPRENHPACVRSIMWLYFFAKYLRRSDCTNWPDHCHMGHRRPDCILGRREFSDRRLIYFSLTPSRSQPTGVYVTAYTNVQRAS